MRGGTRAESTRQRGGKLLGMARWCGQRTATTRACMTAPHVVRCGKLGVLHHGARAQWPTRTPLPMHTPTHPCQRQRTRRCQRTQHSPVATPRRHGNTAGAHNIAGANQLGGTGASSALQHWRAQRTLRASRTRGHGDPRHCERRQRHTTKRVPRCTTELILAACQTPPRLTTPDTGHVHGNQCAATHGAAGRLLSRVHGCRVELPHREGALSARLPGGEGGGRAADAARVARSARQAPSPWQCRRPHHPRHNHLPHPGVAGMQ